MACENDEVDLKRLSDCLLTVSSFDCRSVSVAMVVVECKDLCRHGSAFK